MVLLNDDKQSKLDYFISTYTYFLDDSNQFIVDFSGSFQTQPPYCFWRLDSFQLYICIVDV